MNSAAQRTTAGQPSTVLMVDDSAEFIATATRLLAQHADIELVGTARSATEAFQKIETLHPDLVLMDIVMPDMNGIEATRHIKRRDHAPRVVMLTLHDNTEYRYYAQLAGADGFIAKQDLATALGPQLEQLLRQAPETETKPAAPKMNLVQSLLVQDLAQQQNEERLRFALEAGNMGTFDWDLVSDVITWSEQHSRLFGLKHGEFHGSYTAFCRYVHPEDLASVEACLLEARQTQKDYKQKFRIVWPDASVHWICSQGKFRYDAQGEAIRMTGVVADVSEFMTNLHELQAKSERLQSIFEMDPQCILLLDTQGNIQEVNPSGLKLFGEASSQALVGRALQDYIAPAYREIVQSFFHSVQCGNSGKLQFEIIRTDGTRRYVENHACPLQSSDHDERVVLNVLLDITAQTRTENKLNHLAHHDPLTGLPNRILFNDRLSQAMVDAQRHKRLAGVVVLDLDRFKNINDTLGHDVGDDTLVAVTERLRTAIRPSDTLARLGGDEFAIVLADMDKAEDAPLVVERILDTFMEAFHVRDREQFMSASLGITLFPADGDDCETLLRNADTAMYRAKAAGRCGYQFYTAEMTQRAHEDMALESALRHAIERDELAMHYQPIIDIDTGRITGMESLMRWQHPELGFVSPERFIPLAEETGLIISLGEWALSTACTQTRRWHEQGFDDLYVAVNLSSRQFRANDLIGQVTQALERSGLDARHLVLELTESMLSTDIDNTIHVMQILHNQGIRFALDDFGTGYSSLNYLKRFPIDILKIDQSFVRDISTDPDDAAIVRAIITMAHSLGDRVVAEGVETQDQMEFLRANDCDAMQGYLLSRPLPAAEFQTLLSRP
ncbi:MAG: EAL domain-containing protein [Gammaproteobacteria bacterium]